MAIKRGYSDRWRGGTGTLACDQGGCLPAGGADIAFYVCVPKLARATSRAQVFTAAEKSWARDSGLGAGESEIEDCRFEIQNSRTEQVRSPRSERPGYGIRGTGLGIREIEGFGIRGGTNLKWRGKLVPTSIPA